jgi:hypothetical protein
MPLEVVKLLKLLSVLLRSLSSSVPNLTFIAVY